METTEVTKEILKTLSQNSDHLIMAQNKQGYVQQINYYTSVRFKLSQYNTAY